MKNIGLGGVTNVIKQAFSISSPSGLGSRAAAALVREANQFHCDMELAYQDEVADLKSIMNVMALVIRQGESFELRCEGEDEDQAFHALVHTMTKTSLI
jgi:phosphocarrier protein